MPVVRKSESIDASFHPRDLKEGVLAVIVIGCGCYERAIVQRVGKVLVHVGHPIAWDGSDGVDDVDNMDDSFRVRPLENGTELVVNDNYV